MNRQAVAQTNAQRTVATVPPGGLLQRACACGQHTGGGAECAECSKKRIAESALGVGILQRRPARDREPEEVSEIVHDVLRSPGQPLDAATRAFFEPHFAHDLSRARAEGRVLDRMQAKLAVGQPGDRYEEEADRTAEQVMQMDALATPSGSVRCTPAGNSQILRVCTGRRCNEHQRLKGVARDEWLQTKAEAGSTPEIGASAQARIESLESGGEPLPPAFRSFFEPKFGRDFSQVRVHTGSLAAETARDVHANAYTLGHHIVFAEGKYAPETAAGKKLLAHELTHVVQQETGTSFQTGPLAGFFKAGGVLVQRSNAADTRLPKDEPEAISFATAAEAAINAANTRLGAAKEPARRNVPSFISLQALALQALTPRHDNAIGAVQLNFFAGQVNYSDSVTLPDRVTHHVKSTRTAVRIRAREHANVDSLLTPDEIERRLVQAVSEVAYTAAARSGAASAFDLYRAQFNGFWDAPPFSAMSPTFDATLSSKGPRTPRARAIFERIYQDDSILRTAYDNNTGGIRERIDIYTGPESLNPINSPRLQTLRAAFFPFAAPVPNANYLAFRTAVTSAAAALDPADRQAVDLSNDWQQLINRHVTTEAKRQEIRQIIATPPPTAPPPAVAPAAAAPPAPAVGGGVTPQQFVDGIRIDGPTAPIAANARTEQVTVKPKSSVANPNVAIDTRFTVTPAARIQGASISPASQWPNGAAVGVAFQPRIINTSTVNMNAHLDLVNGPLGLAPASPIPDLQFQVQDNRQANFVASWFTDVTVNTGAGQDFLSNVTSGGGAVRYRGGTQNFEIGAFLPSPQTNPGLALFVKTRLKRGATVVSAPTQLAPFPPDLDEITPISININAPVTVPVAGDHLTFEVELIAADRVTILSTKTISMTVTAEQTYTKAQAIIAATADQAHLNDPSATGLLGQMTAQGGLAARVSAAIQAAPPAPHITLQSLTVRHDSAAYVTAVRGGSDPTRVGYFVGTTYNNTPPDPAHSFDDVAGAEALFVPSGFGPRFIVANRTTDVAAGTKRPDADLITSIAHEAVHALDVRPGSGTLIERYKTEFRAYWMDGELGPPGQGTCPPPITPFTSPCPPVGASCFDAAYRPDLPPPGPKSCRARAIFTQQLYGSVTYPWVKPAYDNNTAGFRDAVDNYLIPDGINLIVSTRLEALRHLIANWSGAGFVAFRDKVRAFRGQGPAPAPVVGVLDSDEENEINRDRAWRDLVNAHVSNATDRNQIKTDLNIPL